MLNFLFGRVSLKRLVMKRVNEKIAEYQERLDKNIEELKDTKRNALFVAWDNYLDSRNKILSDHKYNTDTIVNTHVTNLLNKVI